MKREEAMGIVREFIKNENLIKHMRAVEVVMRAYARKYGEDEDSWGLVGLLHDFDWEIHPNLDEHPAKGAPILRERGVDEEDIRSILSHAEHTGIPRATLRDKVLFAVDELTGLVTAVALVRPSKSIFDVTAQSIKKKWKDRAFAAGANREEIEQGCRELDIDLWSEHVPFVLQAMQSIASELGLEGQSDVGKS
ncbi:MAG: HDIG domain-containing protein [Anaerolineae bacterium]|nr:HDIG domain-containing protein [Anaerolineae bacterium]